LKFDDRFPVPYGPDYRGPAPQTAAGPGIVVGPGCEKLTQFIGVAPMDHDPTDILLRLAAANSGYTGLIGPGSLASSRPRPRALAIFERTPASAGSARAQLSGKPRRP